MNFYIMKTNMSCILNINYYFPERTPETTKETEKISTKESTQDVEKDPPKKEKILRNISVAKNYRKTAMKFMNPEVMDRDDWKKLILSQKNTINEDSYFNVCPYKDDEELFYLAVSVRPELLFRYENRVVDMNNIVLDPDYFINLPLTNDIINKVKGGLTREHYFKMMEMGKIGPLYNDLFFHRKDKKIYPNPDLTNKEFESCLECLDFARSDSRLMLLETEGIPDEVNYEYVARRYNTDQYVDRIVYHYGGYSPRLIYESLKYGLSLYKGAMKSHKKDAFSYVMTMEYDEYYNEKFKKSDYIVPVNYDLNFSYEWRYTL